MQPQPTEPRVVQTSLQSTSAIIAEMDGFIDLMDKNNLLVKANWNAFKSQILLSPNGADQSKVKEYFAALQASFDKKKPAHAVQCMDPSPSRHGPTPESADLAALHASLTSPDPLFSHNPPEATLGPHLDSLSSLNSQGVLLKPLRIREGLIMDL